MDNETYKIVDVYHKHIDCKARDDVWSRQNFHGLNLDYLHKYGHRCLCDFIADFQRWLNKFHILQLYANNPHKERVLLHTSLINDLLLPVWRQRVSQPYHQVAVCFKDLNVPILNTKCDSYVHNAYDCFIRNDESDLEKLKRLHGYHCSLYDCYELYLFYLFETRSL